MILKAAKKNLMLTMNSDLSVIVEGVLLFLNLQCKHLTRTSLKQQKPGLVVTIDTVRSAPNETSSESAHTACNVQVLASGLGAYFLDGAAFIKQLCALCPMLLGQSAAVPPPQTADSALVLEILCRRVGEPGNVTRYTLEGIRTEESGQVREPLIRETVAARPSNLHPAALSVKILFCSVEEDLRLSGGEIARHMHLVQLVNPELSLSLRVRDDNKESIINILFEPTCSRALSRGLISLAISASHYTKLRSESSQPFKLRLVKGDTQTLPDSLVLHNGRKLPLKLFTAVSVLPQLRLKKAITCIAHGTQLVVEIFIYGPCSLPLAQPGSQPGFPLSLLADWESYGLTLAHTRNPPDHTDLKVVVPSFVCDATSSRRHTSEHPPHKHTLLLFLFLEDPSARENSRLSDGVQWKHQVEMVHRLRGEFQELVLSHTKKFQQATHSALNKIACNYGSHSKTRSAMGTALPLVADAVASIVRNSTDQSFRAACVETLQAANVGDISSRVEQKLWRIAKKKLGVSHPSDTNSKDPNEPTTPELALAVEGSQTDSAQSGTSTAVTTTPAEHVLVDHSDESKQDSLSLPTTSTNENSQMNDTQRTQSLFSARVHSRKVHQEKPHSEVREVLQDDDDDTCFDSLSDLPFDHNGEAVSDSQPSQSLLGATTGAAGSEHCTVGLDRDTGDEDMSISSFEALGGSIGDDSLTEGEMEYDSYGENSTNVSGYDELELYEDNDQMFTDIADESADDVSQQPNNSNTVSSQMIDDEGYSRITEESQSFLPVDRGEIIQEQVTSIVDYTTSDDDWDHVLTCNSNVPSLSEQATLDPPSFEPSSMLMATSDSTNHSQPHEPPPTTDTIVIMNRQEPTSEDFEQLADYSLVVPKTGLERFADIDTRPRGHLAEDQGRAIPASTLLDTSHTLDIDNNDFEWD